MRSARPMLVILGSLVVGAVAVAIAAQWVSRQASIATTRVVVAARDLDIGTRLRADQLQVVEWPSGVPLKDPVASPREIEDRVLNAQVLRGEPVLKAKLAPPGEKGGLSAVLPEGKRAITVKVNEVVGVAGFALPGNYVDVMVNAADEANRPTSKIVLERILVLAVAQDLSTGETKPRVVNAVTLEVTPAEAERIDLARSIGTLSLVLRSQFDKSRTDTAGARKQDLIKAGALPASVAERAAAPAKTAPKRAETPARRADAAKARPAPGADERMEVIRGMQKTVE